MKCTGIDGQLNIATAFNLLSNVPAFGCEWHGCTCTVLHYDYLDESCKRGFWLLDGAFMATDKLKIIYEVYYWRHGELKLRVI